MHAVERVGVQSLAVAHIFQRGALHFKGGTDSRGRGDRQQRFDERRRSLAAETVVERGLQAARSHRPDCIGAVGGFGPVCQLYYAGDRFSGRRIQKLSAAELDLCGVDICQHHIGREQQRGDACLLHDRVGLTVHRKQGAVRKVQPEAAQGVLFRAAVLQRDVDGIGRDRLAPEAGHALELARQLRHGRSRGEARGGEADVGNQHRVGAGVGGVDQLGAAGSGDLHAHWGVNLRSSSGGGRPPLGHLRRLRLGCRPECLG